LTPPGERNCLELRQDEEILDLRNLLPCLLSIESTPTTTPLPSQRPYGIPSGPYRHRDSYPRPLVNLYTDSHSITTVVDQKHDRSYDRERSSKGDPVGN